MKTHKELVDETILNISKKFEVSSEEGIAWLSKIRKVMLEI